MQVSAIKQMERLAREDRSIISLSQGIPFSNSDAYIRTEVVRALRENKVDRYSDPQGMRSLREAIALYLSKKSMSYSPDEILVTGGAVEAMISTLLGCLSPGDAVIVPTPTYAAFIKACEVAELQAIPIRLQEEAGWMLDPEQLLRSLTPQTKAIMLCQPNNPTGSLYSKRLLQSVGKLAREHNLYVIVDEVYAEMLYADNHIPSLASDERFRKNVIRIESFSKNFSLTGWRIGFLHTTRQNIEKILPVHDAILNCAPVISQYAALAALSMSKEVLNERMNHYRYQRELMGSYLEELDEFLSFQYPEGTYFFFPKIKGVTNAVSLCSAIISEAKVAVVPGDDFGLGGEGHIRLCFGRSRKDITIGMERLVHYFKKR